ncbi:MAG TPA: PAS domain S-box protein [Steroidobacteraceae bacterium]|jgi:PAS domain S-box-containing protein|nr:PAS domain S-box protein [Steroidobacteraceae bacterium]
MASLPVIGLVALLVGAVLLVLWLARALRAARRWGARLANLVEAVPDQGLLLLDAAGRVIHCNAAARRLHGYGDGEIEGQHYALLFTPEERRERVPENELEAAARDGPFTARSARVHRDGRRIMVQTRLTALREPAGRLGGFSVVENDLSERLGQDQALAEARATLAGVHKLVALGRLSEGIAHEFNNVVHVIKTAVALLQQRGATDEQAASFLHMIKRNADRAAGLSQHLLALARRQPLNLIATDVNDVVATVAALLRQTFSENIIVEEQLDEALSWVVVDRSELEAALLHVAANARDAMPQGGRLSFHTAEVLQPAAVDAGRPARHSVVISIRDSASTQAALADEAQSVAAGSNAAAGRTHADESSLDLVRGLLDHSHAQLQVERGGEGSTVSVYLPARAG